MLWFLLGIAGWILLLLACWVWLNGTLAAPTEAQSPSRTRKPAPAGTPRVRQPQG